MVKTSKQNKSKNPKKLVDETIKIVLIIDLI
jgi:hypothetical protein